MSRRRPSLPGVQAELTRLARLLDCAADDVADLARFDAAELRALRLAVATRQRARGAAVHARLARAGRLVPPRVTASVAHRTMPARVAAEVVSAMRPDHAVEVAHHLPVDYLADVTRHLAPDAAVPVVTGLSEQVLLSVSHELRRRDDFTTMAEVVTALTAAQVEAVAGALDDAAALLQVALHITDDAALDRLVRTLPEPLLARMARRARREARAWPHLLDLLRRLPADRRRRLLASAAQA